MKALRSSLLVIAALMSLVVSGCGPKAFTKGEYDKDVERDNLLNDQWSETDMQKAVKDLVDSLVAHNSIAAANRPPVVMVTNLQNKTTEHIDTQNIMDMIRVELMNRGRVSFVDKEAREDVSKEYEYQNSGMVNETTKKGPGKQVGADFILNGRLDSNVQEVGKDKTVYYKLTLNLTNLDSNLVTWSQYKQIRKVYKKKSIGL
ncbi:MAG: penicillin-binding protein activator LpoB [Bdellovibrionia bacterium]